MTAGDPEIIGSTALYIGDCLGILPLLRGVDHVIADPPYEDELHGAVGGIERIDGRAPPQGPDFPGIGGTRAEAAMKIASCACGWAAVFTLAEGVGAWRGALQAAGARPDTTLCWVKPDAAPRFNGQGAARGFECIATAWCGTGHRRWNGGGRRGVFAHLTGKGGHPCAKPVALIMELVALYTRPGPRRCSAAISPAPRAATGRWPSSPPPSSMPSAANRKPSGSPARPPPSRPSITMTFPRKTTLASSGYSTGENCS